MKKLRNFVVGFALAILSISASAIPSPGDYAFPDSFYLSGTFTSDGSTLTAWDIKDDLGGMYLSPATEALLWNVDYFWSSAYFVSGEGLHKLDIWWAGYGPCVTGVSCASWTLAPNWPDTDDTLGTGVVSLEFLAVPVPVPSVTLLLVLGVAGMAVAGRVKFRAVSI